MFYSHRSTGQAFSFFRRRVCNTDTGIDLPPCFIIQQSCFNLRHRYLHKVLRLGSSFQVQESVPCDWCHHLSSSGENTRQHWRLHGPYTVNTHYCVPTRHPNQVSTTASLRVTLHLSVIQTSCLALCGTLISSFFFRLCFCDSSLLLLTSILSSSVVLPGASSGLVPLRPLFAYSVHSFDFPRVELSQSLTATRALRDKQEQVAGLLIDPTVVRSPAPYR